MDYIKLRLGTISGHGQQKGVDSLIVTDLIELARNHAITDAVILSGDEDIRIGVQIAQSFGVRVHLIGIIPSRGSQSPHLLQESDTTTEWDKPTVSKFLSVKPSVMTAPPIHTIGPSLPAPQSSGMLAIDNATAASLDAVALSMTNAMGSSEVTAIKTYWKTQRGVPQEIDGKLLARGRAQIGRDLSAEEKRHIRAKFSQTVQNM